MDFRSFSPPPKQQRKRKNVKLELTKNIIFSYTHTEFFSINHLRLCFSPFFMSSELKRGSCLPPPHTLRLPPAIVLEKQHFASLVEAPSRPLESPSAHHVVVLPSVSSLNRHSSVVDTAMPIFITRDDLDPLYGSRVSG